MIDLKIRKKTLSVLKDPKRGEKKELSVTFHACTLRQHHAHCTQVVKIDTNVSDHDVCSSFGTLRCLGHAGAHRGGRGRVTVCRNVLISRKSTRQIKE